MKDLKATLYFDSTSLQQLAGNLKGRHWQATIETSFVKISKERRGFKAKRFARPCLFVTIN